MTAPTAALGAGGWDRHGRKILGGLALLFGAATLFEGGHTLFGGPEARAAAGDVVPFVLAFNFSAGFAYVAAAAGILAGRRWALHLARLLAVSTALVFVAFGAHVAGGGAFEPRTVVAMTLRTGFWVVQSILLPRVLDGGAARAVGGRG